VIGYFTEPMVTPAIARIKTANISQLMQDTAAPT
jgi:hypothetical protein